MDSHLLRFQNKKNVFIDLETFNLCLNFQHNRPWQVAMIKTEKDKVIDKRDIYVDWWSETNLDISKDAARITKFNKKKVMSKAISSRDAFSQLAEWLDDADNIIGHNIIGFDVHLIKEWYHLQGKSWDHLVDKFIDTNCIAKAYKLNESLPEGKSLVEFQHKMYYRRAKGIRTNQTALGKEFKIDFDYENLHDALKDLELNMLIWNQLKWRIDI